MTKDLHISVSPHIHSGHSTQRIMLDVIIALIPAALAGTLIFGARSLAVIAACVLSCVLSEALFNIIVKKGQTVSDLSAVVTGLLLALNLPENVPLWQAVIGSVFAIVIVKCIFGGLGKNLVNPAITARVFMIVSFGAIAAPAYPKNMPDAISGATPLVLISEGNTPSLIDLLLGRHGGAIGETCALALLLGGAYLIVRKTITWHVPVSFMVGTYLFSFLFGGFDPISALASVLSGGLIIGAIYMATDYVTSPSTPWGKIVFGIGCAFITVVIRIWGVYPEGVSFAILLMNILVPYIESFTSRRLFGGKRV